MITQLIKDGENQYIEFKTSFQKEVISSIVAFANAKGGKILIGVSDGGDILGIDVKEYPIKPISCKSRYYIRKANSNHLMSMEEIANEYLKTKNSSWDYYVDTMQNFSDISLEKVNKFIKKIEQNFNKTFDENPMQVLQKYGLVREDNITFGAYLLFVKDFCLISGVQAGRFKTPTDIIDSISLNTDILTEVDELIIFIRKHLMVEYIITGNPQREERYDYPLDAIREIVLNMIVHRDYRSSSDSIIKIFDDKIEFYNSGALYDNLTVEQLLSNNYESKTRNKLIALMFKECGLIEKYGSGISRIKRLCTEHNIVEPKFEEISNGFKVTLYKQKINEGINEGIKSLYLLVESYPNRKTPFFAKELNTSVKNIERWIKQLKEQGHIEFRGSKKTGGYYAKEK